MTRRSICIFVALSGFLLVALGAFGSHLLSRRLPADHLAWIHIGLEYQAWHTLAMLGLAAASGKAFGRSAALFGLGILLFSGSLYGLALTSVTFFAWITPIGGLSFLAGWLVMLTGALRLQHKADSHE